MKAIIMIMITITLIPIIMKIILVSNNNTSSNKISNNNNNKNNNVIHNSNNDCYADNDNPMANITIINNLHITGKDIKCQIDTI